MERIQQAIAETGKRRERPSGRLRIVIPRTATELVLMPKLSEFSRRFPEVFLEITSSYDPVDLVAGGYDAGVHIGEYVQRNMTAVPISGEMRLAVVGSKEYFGSNLVPRHPRDLVDHACIGFRLNDHLYPWKFGRRQEEITVVPHGPVAFDDPDLVIQAALMGMGIGAAPESSLEELIAQGRLTRVLKDWCPSFAGYFLYYPVRRNQPAALVALIEALRFSK